MNQPIEKQRTPKQNNAFWLFCEQLGDHLNESGFEQRITIGTIDVPWTKDRVHDFFMKIAYAMYKKTSSADLTTKEMSMTYEVLNRYLASRGLHLPWPSYQAFIQYDELSTK